MILIEGPDLVGKTTLAGSIAWALNELGWPHVRRHLSRPPQAWAREPVTAYRQQLGPYVVQDRLHLSELAYRHADGGRPHMSHGEFAQVDRELLAFCGLTVVITADEQIIRERHREHIAREMYDVDAVLRANEWFELHAACGVTTVPTTGSGMAEWRAHVPDVHVRLTPGMPYPVVPDVPLRLYTSRMLRRYPWPGALEAP